MKGSRIVWGIILVILIAAALAYFGTMGNLNRTARPPSGSPATGQQIH